MSTVLVLGSTGRAGRRISAHLMAAGLDVVLAGRDASRLQAVAGDLQVPPAAIRVVDVSDTQALQAALSGVDLVVNTVGPFMALAAPVVEAVMHAGACYVDLANEQPAVHALLARDGDARSAGVTLVTGAGLGLVATEYLSLQLTSNLTAPPASVRSVLLTWNSAPSAGVKASAAAAMTVGSTRYVGGELVHAPIGADRWQVELAGQARTLIAAPLGDVEAIRAATGAADVSAFVEAPPGAGIGGDVPRSLAHVEMVVVDGAVTAATLEPGDSLTATAAIATTVVLGVLQDRRPGAWTPGALLGTAPFDGALRT